MSDFAKNYPKNYRTDVLARYGPQNRESAGRLENMEGVSTPNRCGGLHGANGKPCRKEWCSQHRPMYPTPETSISGGGCYPESLHVEPQGCPQRANPAFFCADPWQCSSFVEASLFDPADMSTGLNRRPPPPGNDDSYKVPSQTSQHPGTLFRAKDGGIYWVPSTCRPTLGGGDALAPSMTATVAHCRPKDATVSPEFTARTKVWWDKDPIGMKCTEQTPGCYVVPNFTPSSAPKVSFRGDPYESLDGRQFPLCPSNTDLVPLERGQCEELFGQINNCREPTSSTWGLIQDTSASTHPDVNALTYYNPKVVPRLNPLARADREK
jgi:hypothetical protein